MTDIDFSALKMGVKGARSGRPEMGMITLSVARIAGAVLLIGFTAKPSLLPKTP